jgi:hypothetical protein
LRVGHRLRAREGGDKGGRLFVGNVDNVPAVDRANVERNGHRGLDEREHVDEREEGQDTEREHDRAFFVIDLGTVR